ncbi:DEAD/DEAH box helicase [Haloimpatiens sp. FM7330]|uniref:DEAD/DEAH box helicase n=1 Tax=Haloimpatiens sp. FM7330 TaxID=3298610 RepID=UPI003632A0A3
MRGTLSDEEIRLTVDLLINKYELSTKFLNKLFGRDLKEASSRILNEIEFIEVDKKNLCRLLVVKEGINLFSGSSENKRELRRKILEKMPDNTIIELYNKYPDINKNISTVSYMRTPLVNRKWYSGKFWAVDFVTAAGFPKIFAGIGSSRQETKSSVELIEPKRKVPPLVEYQKNIKNKLLNILNQEGDKTRCMISLPTGGGKTRVAVEAFLDWMEASFQEEKYLLWIAQSEELCEQCISCIEQMWRSREFILPLKIYRYFSKYDFKLEELQGGVVVGSINKIYKRIESKDPVILNILSNTGAMIIDEAHRASTMMYDVLFKEANYLTNNKLFSVCGLSATPGRNTIISENEVDKLVNRFQMNLITPEFKDDSKYKENPLEYFKEYKYLSKVNHIVFRSNIEYKLTEKELKDLEDKKEYSPLFLKKIAKDTKRNTMIVKRLIKIKRGSPTLVYACTVKHAKFLSTILNVLGRRSAYIDSNTNKMERRIIIKQFTEGHIEFLFNYGVLTTGFDAPKTRNIVICRPINSDILYEQIVGRGIRGTRFGGTEECDVIDFSDNIYHLGRQQTYMRFKNYWDKENHE